MYLRKIFFVFVLSIVLVGCSSNGKETYSHDEANRIQTTLVGTVEQVEIVNVSGTSSWKGTLTGSILGGVLGSTIGNGWGRVISSAVGSIGGSFAGAGVERELTKDEGLKMSIRQDDGNVFSVIIVPKKGETFKVGDKVRVISSSSGSVAVSHL
ncbi:hypothetical protein DKL61_09000 [Gammaproteobacteria bacterium ESL0073]|nr:hypothetical protein DKL61_09000 [Gammaproteobacteria bacterium ESL0073]